MMESDPDFDFEDNPLENPIMGLYSSNLVFTNFLEDSSDKGLLKGELDTSNPFFTREGLSKGEGPEIVRAANLQASLDDHPSFFETAGEEMKPQPYQHQASPGSASLGPLDDDSQFSPLSVGAEAMTWSGVQPAAGDPEDGAVPLPTSVAVVSSGQSVRLEVKSYSGTTERENQRQSSSSSLPGPAFQSKRTRADPEPSGGATLQQIELLASAVRQQDTVRQDFSQTVELNESQRGVKRKADECGRQEEEQACSPSSSKMSRNEKNAIAARENRQKKKRELEDLKYRLSAKEEEVDSLRKDFTEENHALRKTNSEQSEEIKSLRNELEYYKSVLFNDSALSTVLKSMNPTPNIKLSTTFRGPGNNLLSSKDAQRPTVNGRNGGICLYVSGNSPDATLELCPTCAFKAQATFDS